MGHTPTTGGVNMNGFADTASDEQIQETANMLDNQEFEQDDGPENEDDDFFN